MPKKVKPKKPPLIPTGTKYQDGEIIHEETGQKLYLNVPVMIVGNTELEPNEQLSNEEATSTIYKWEKKKPIGQFSAYALEDRILFVKTKPKGKEAPRPWVYYDEVQGINTGGKKMDTFVLSIQSKDSGKLYYEIYRCTNADDLRKIEQQIKETPKINTTKPTDSEEIRRKTLLVQGSEYNPNDVESFELDSEESSDESSNYDSPKVTKAHSAKQNDYEKKIRQSKTTRSLSEDSLSSESKEEFAPVKVKKVNKTAEVKKHSSKKKISKSYSVGYPSSESEEEVVPTEVKKIHRTANAAKPRSSQKQNAAVVKTHVVLQKTERQRPFSYSPDSVDSEDLSPLSLKRKHLSKLEDVTYINYDPQNGIELTDDGPIYMYAHRTDTPVYGQTSKHY